MKAKVLVLGLLVSVGSHAHQGALRSSRPVAAEKEGLHRCHLVRNTVASWFWSLTGNHSPTIIAGPFDGRGEQARDLCEADRLKNARAKKAFCSCASFSSLNLQEKDAQLTEEADAGKAR